MKHLLTFIVATICGIAAGVIIAATVTVFTAEPSLEEGRAALLEEAKKAHEDEYFRSAK